MKASRFSEAQKAFILKQGSDGMPVADICRKAGISPATYFNWKKRYDGMQVLLVVVLHSRALVLVRSTDNVRSISAARRVAVPSGSLSSQTEQVTVAAAAFLVRTGRFKGPRAFA